MRSYFVFNGQSSADFKIGIERWRDYTSAGRKVDRQSIPGRAGNLIRETGTLENSPQRYSIWFNAKETDTIEAAGRVIAWLMSGHGYCRLEDSYEPDVYRLAAFNRKNTIKNFRNLFGRLTVEFDCMPQHFLKAGEQPINLVSGQELQNPGEPTLPLLQLTGTGSGEITVGTSTITISDMAGSLTIDSDTQNAYDGSQNKNGTITVSGGFPVLGAGKTKIVWSGGITAVSITPRWWRL